MKNLLTFQSYTRRKIFSSAKYFVLKSSRTLLLISFLFLYANVSAQITTSAMSNTEYVEKLVGQGISFSNVSVQGSTNSIRYFTGGQGAGLPGVYSGIVMSTGTLVNPNYLQGVASTARSTNMGMSGIPELNTLAGFSTYDGIMLQFDFVPTTEELNIRFAFGSEEYNEWTNSSYNDVFGFFIYGPGFPAGGKNIALTPNGQRVSIKTINNGTSCPATGPCTNCAYYTDNCQGTLNVIDGYTSMLIAKADVIPCETYTIKLMLADGSDAVLDSWVFLQESGFFAAGTVVESETIFVEGLNVVYEGCHGTELTFTIAQPLDYDYTFDLEFSGTADIFDYLPLPPSVTIPAGQTSVSFPIVAIMDGIEEGVETLIIKYQESVCEEGEIIIEIHDMPEMEIDLGEDITICSDTPQTLTATIENELGELTYSWSDGTSVISTEESITVSPTETTTYTVTITDICGQVAEDSLTIIVDEDIEPLFSFLTTYCKDDTADVLPSVSDDGITGAWSPSVISTANLGTLTYTFTPDPDQCAVAREIEVTINELEVPVFNPVAPICQGAFILPGTLPNVSLNGIQGSWSPALNNQTTTTYTFTPLPGECAEQTTLQIVVEPKVTPVFNNIPDSYCQGATMGSLPQMSSNFITGTWSPPLNNQQTTNYTFFPNPGQCTTQVQVTIKIIPITTPDFIQIPPICAGDFLADLPTTSPNGVSGVWSPAINNTQTTTYTFTPVNTSTVCGETVEMTIVVNQPVTPTFSFATTICEGTGLTLPTISDNGISGSWSPAFDNTQTMTYTFTPDSGECAVPTDVEVVVAPILTPDFTQINPICAGEALADLPTISNNGINGSWSPALDTTQTKTYTFTPNAGECAVPTTMEIVVNPIITPTFTQVAAICAGTFIPPLPSTSDNGISGSWSPALNYNQTTEYTFTPNANGQCAVPVTMTIVVNQPSTPAFTQVDWICAGEPLTDLPTVSINGISGVWSPAIDNTQTTTYTFTPNSDQCSLSTTMTIVVKEWITPTFSIEPICADSTSPLPNVSDNGVVGSWSPEFGESPDGKYTFTPDPGQCGVVVDVDVTIIGSVVAPSLLPLEYCDPDSDGFGVFDLTQVLPIIEGANAGFTVNVSFHETAEDAEFNANDISLYNLVTAYPNGSPYTQTIYVRVASNSGCYSVTTLDLKVYDLPKIIKTMTILEECDDDTDGFTQFDLSGSLLTVLDGLNASDHTISYHLTENDARNSENPILNFINYTNTSANQSVWVRVESNATGCFDVAEVKLQVNPLPVVHLPEVDRYVVCDDDTDGIMTFDLSTQIAGIVNGQTGLTVTFYGSYSDAENKTNPHNNSYTNVQTPTETVFVRVETEKGCSVITLMDLVVEPLPVIFAPTDPVIGCDLDADKGDGLGVVDFTKAIEAMLYGADSSAYVVTIHESISDAEFGQNPINTTSYFNTNPFAQILYVRVESTTGEKCFTVYPIEINITPSPQLPVNQNGKLDEIVICDDNTDGYAYFDFTDQTQTIFDYNSPNFTDLSVTYHLNESNAIAGVLAISTPTNYPNVSNPQQIWVRIESLATGCFDVASFDLKVNLPLELPTIPAITICDEDRDGEVVFDLTIRIPDILANTNAPDNFEVAFFTSYDSAKDNILSDLISTPGSYLLNSHVRTLGIRVTDKTTGCQSYTIMDVRRAPMPSVPSVALNPIQGCQQDGNPNIEGFFDLTIRESFIRQGDPNLIISYHLTDLDAQNGENAIVNTTNFSSPNTTIYIRVANPPNGGVVCFVVLEVDIIVNPLPVIAKNSFAVCQENSTGIAEFDLSLFSLELLGPTQNINDFTINYYLTQSDAENQTGAINQSVPYENVQPNVQPIWVRVTDKNTGCFVVTMVTLYAEERAEATQPLNNTIFACDDQDGVNDGFVSGINLSVYQNEILNGQNPTIFLVSYHVSQTDAEQGLNAINNPSNFTNTAAGGQTIWVRVENSQTQAPCYALATIKIEIEQPANLVISSNNNVLCIDWKTSTSPNPVVLNSGVFGSGYTFEWYHNGVLLPGANQSTLTISNLGDEGMYSVRATSSNGCVSEISSEFEVLLSGIAEIVNISTTNPFSDSQDIIVKVEGHGQYAFQLDNGQLQDTGHFTNVSPGVHTVTVYDITQGDINLWNSCGNATIDDVQIIDYPKFFTPNEDGYNDRWNIIGLNEFHQAEIFIFDRYGKLLKQLNPLGEGWDGTYNGNRLPATDYWFKVLYNQEDNQDGNIVKRREFKAHFSLKR